MSATDMNKPSATNWDRVDALSDADIDTSDIPPLDEAFFARATLRLPQGKVRQEAGASDEHALLVHAVETLPTEGIRRLRAAGMSEEQIAAGIQGAVERYIAEELQRV